MITASSASIVVSSQPLQLFHLAALAPHGVFADLARFAAGKPGRRHAAVAGQDRAVHLFEETDGAADAIAGVPFAAAARASANVEILQHHRIAELQHLGVGEPRIGHMRVHGIGAIETRPGGRAGADGLVVLVFGVAEIEIVHGALRRGERAERQEQAIGDGLRGLHIAGDHGGRIFRHQHRFRRNDDVDRPQAPGIHRDVVVDHHAKHVEHRRARHRLRRVEIGRLLRRGAGEIDGRFALFLVDGDLHLDEGALVHLVGIFGVVHAVDDAAHAFRRIVLHVLHVGPDHGQGELIDHLAQLGDAFLIGGNLRLHVVDVLHRIARRIFGAGERGHQLLFAEAAAIDELEIVHVDAFLLDGRRIRRHRAGRNAADIGMMAARGDPEQDRFLPVVEDRRAHGDVGEMRAAVIGRVDRIDVAGSDRVRHCRG